jgi:hypothetical protein
MPSVNTKPLASRVTKEEYYLLLKEAANKQMTLSQFLKDVVIDSYINTIRASRGVKLESSPVAKKETIPTETNISLQFIEHPYMFRGQYLRPFKRSIYEVSVDFYKERCSPMVECCLCICGSHYFLYDKNTHEVVEIDIKFSPILKIINGKLFFIRKTLVGGVKEEDELEEASYGKAVKYPKQEIKWLKSIK